MHHCAGYKFMLVDWSKPLTSQEAHGLVSLQKAWLKKTVINAMGRGSQSSLAMIDTHKLTLTPELRFHYCATEMLLQCYRRHAATL